VVIMNNPIRILLAALAALCAVAGEASAQNVLNRVERLVREQLGSAAKPGTEPGYLGLVADDSPDGVRVLDLAPNGPAAQAGMQRGDTIQSVDGKPVRVMDDLAAGLEAKTPGARLVLTIERDGKQQRKTVTLGQRRPPAAAEELPGPKQAGPRLPPANAPPGPRLGVRTLPVTDDVMRNNKLPDSKGAVIVAIAPGSPAEQAGVLMGAVIVGLNEQPIASPQELADAMRQVNQPELNLTYYHHGERIQQKIPLGEADAPAAKPSDEPVPPQPDTELEGGADLAGANRARIEALEARLAELEARLKQLEDRLPAAPQP
jgi:S1-C subfamily serine protease